MSRPRPTRAALLLLALAAAAALWWQTPHGLGLEGDSGDYVSMARQLAAGELPRFDAADGRSLPMTQFPPGYPLVLSIGPRLGLDVLAFARVLHVALLAATVLLVGGLALRHTRSAPVALAAAAYIAVSPQVHWTFASLMSEALFVPLILLIALLWKPGRNAAQAAIETDAARSGRRPGPRCDPAFRVAAYSLVSVIPLTRFAGTFVLPALVASRGTTRRRLVGSTLLLLLTLAPVAAWSLYLRHLGAEPSRVVRFHPPDAATLRRALSAVGGWAWPFGGAAAGAAGVLVIVALTWAVIRRLKRPRRAGRGAGVWAAMLLCYAAGLWASRLLLDEAMPMGVRLWLPGLPLAVLLAADTARRDRRWLAAVGVVICLSAAATSRQALDLRRDGIGYASPAWRDSPTLAYIRSLPPGTAVVTNAADAVGLLLGRDARPLPMTVFRTSGNDNVRWRDQLRAQGKRLRESGGVIVFFDAVNRSDFLVRERQLNDLLRVEPTAILGDGRVYRVVGVR